MLIVHPPVLGRLIGMFRAQGVLSVFEPKMKETLRFVNAYRPGDDDASGGGERRGAGDIMPTAVKERQKITMSARRAEKLQAARARAAQLAQEYRASGADPVNDLVSTLQVAPEDWSEIYNAAEDRNGF